jgi:oligopeptide transport system ATP-binding protein
MRFRPSLRLLPLALLALASSACDINLDAARFTDKEERRFTVTGTPDVVLSTFDGAIDVRAWDRPEVFVTIEKQGGSQEDAKDIKVTFGLKKGFFGKGGHVLHAVDGVSLSVRAGETVGVVGESGSGKSTLGRAILRLLPSGGIVRFEDRDLMPLDRAGMRPLRRHLQLVFQDPFGSLSPRMTAGEIVTEGLLVHEPRITRRERDRRAAQAFEEVSLDPAWRNRFPHEFSGGQRQRIAIARAMILHPKLVVLDEPTSALDRSVQKEIVELLRELQNAHGLAYVFISHDLAVVRALSDEIMVMKSGKVVERGNAEAIFEKPKQTYTQDLIAAAFLRGLDDVRTGVAAAPVASSR